MYNKLNYAFLLTKIIPTSKDGDPNVDGITYNRTEQSCWAPIMKWDWALVSLGAVIGHLLFTLYINDISTYIESEMMLFANDYVCYRDIKKEGHSETSECHRPTMTLGNENGVLVSNMPNAFMMQLTRTRTKKR